MQYSFVKACLLALAATSSVLAQAAVGFNVITAPTSGDVLVPGTTYTIKWTPSEPAGPVSLILLQGLTNTTLVPGATIGAAIPSSAGQFDWAIPSDAGSFAAYGLKLQLDSNPATFQYSNPFVIRGASVTKTVQLSQISTLASTSTSSTLSSSSSVISSTSTSTSAPVTTSSSSSTSAPVTTSSSSSTSSTIVSFQNSTTLWPTTIVPSTVAIPSASASSTPVTVKTSGAVSNAVRGTGLLGALAVSFFMLL